MTTVPSGWASVVLAVVIGLGLQGVAKGQQGPSPAEPGAEKRGAKKAQGPQAEGPDTGRPGGAAESDSKKPGTRPPQAERPGAGRPETDTPVTEAPEADKPGEEKPDTDKPGMDKPAMAKSVAEFPPGLFSDGGRHELADYRGKVVVLWFFDPTFPNNKKLAVDVNRVVKQFAGKPVKFFGVCPIKSVNDVQNFARSAKLAFPVFNDSLAVMQVRCAVQLPADTGSAFRILGPHGDVVENDMDPSRLEGVVEGVKWKYKDKGYDPKLNKAIELLEWNQTAAALKAIKPLLKDKSEPVKGSAAKLYEAVRSGGVERKAKADEEAEFDPPAGFEQYSALAAEFPDEDFGKEAATAAKKLKADKAVKEELDARKMYGQLYSAMGKASTEQKERIVAFCRSIGEKYPNTPTGRDATQLSTELARISFTRVPRK